METHLIHTTQSNDQIFVQQGRKSAFDFIVKYRSVGKHMRTPKHIHLVLDLYAKMAGDEEKTMEFLDHIIGIIQSMSSLTYFPPKLTFFSYQTVNQFRELDDYGEYSTEFLLVVIELIMLQEKTNYPNGNLNLRLFQDMRRKADIYSVVSTATFR